MTDYSVSSNAVASQPSASRDTAPGSRGLNVNAPLSRGVLNPGPGSFQSYFEQSVGRISQRPDTFDALDTHSDIIEELEERAKEQRQRREQRAEADRARSQQAWQRRADDLEQASQTTRIDEDALSESLDSLRETLREISEEDSSKARGQESAREDTRADNRNRDDPQAVFERTVGELARDATHKATHDAAEADSDATNATLDLTDATHKATHEATNATRDVTDAASDTHTVEGVEDFLGSHTGKFRGISSWLGTAHTSATNAGDERAAESEASGSDDLSPLREALGRDDVEAIEELAETLARVAEEIEQQLESLEGDREAYEKVVEHLNSVLEKMERRRDPQETADAMEMLADLLETAFQGARNDGENGEENLQTQTNNAGITDTERLDVLLSQVSAPGSRSGSQAEGGQDARSVAGNSGQVLVEAIERLVSRLSGSHSGASESDGERDRTRDGSSARSAENTNSFALNKGESNALETGRLATGTSETGVSEAGRPGGEEAERLVNQLRKISDALRDAAEPRESAASETIEGRSRDRSERVGELVIDVRDRRSRNERSGRHRDSNGGSERASAVSDGEQRSERGVQATDHRRWANVHGREHSGGEEGSPRDGNVDAREATSSSREANAASRESAASDGESRFDRLFNPGAESSSSDRASRAAGGSASQVRSNPSSSSAELARSLREHGNADIVRQARVILKDENSGELRLRLKPEGLGNVRIHMELDDKRIDMRIVVENSSVREAFRENIAELQRSFESDGFTTGSFSVDVEGENAGTMSGEQQQNGEEDSEGYGGNSSRGVHELDDAVPFVETGDENERHINVMV